MLFNFLLVPKWIVVSSFYRSLVILSLILPFSCSCNIFNIQTIANGKGRENSRLFNYAAVVTEVEVVQCQIRNSTIVKNKRMSYGYN
jgi:hypothetical protein